MRMTRQLRTAVAAITAMVLLVAGLVGTASVARADGESHAVTAAETKVSLYKDDNATDAFNPQSDALAPGTALYGKLDFTFDASKPTLDSPNVTYTFPSNISVWNDGGTLKDPDGNAIGTWEIKDGVLTLHYDTTWLNGHPNHITASVLFRFTLNSDDTKDPNKDSVKVDFGGDGNDFDIRIDKSTLGGNKSVRQQNADGTVTFAITIDANQFTANDVTVHDTLGKYYSFVPGTFKLDGGAIDDAKVSIDNDKNTADISLGTLAKKDQDQSYVVTYDAKLNDFGKQQLYQSGKLADGAPDKLNTANWTWTAGSDPTTGTPRQYKSADTTADTDYTYKLITKDAGQNADGEVQWQVTLNSGTYREDMDGYTFTDTLSGKQHYKGGDVYSIIDADTNETVTTKPLPTDANQKSFTFTFGKDFLGRDPGRKSYIIRYRTIAEDPSSPAALPNKAEMNKPGYPGGEGDGTYQPSVDYVTKTLIGHQTTDKDALDANGNTITTTDGGKTQTVKQHSAEWESVISLSKMTSVAAPGRIAFVDADLQTAPIRSDDQGKVAFRFDQEKLPVLTIGGTTLQEGVDYTLDMNEYKAWYSHIKINFLTSSKAVQAALGLEDVTVRYWTVSTALPGTYTNMAQVQLDGAKVAQASNKYYIPPSTLVGKRGDTTIWAPDDNHELIIRAEGAGKFSWDRVAEDYRRNSWVQHWHLWANAGDENLEHGVTDIASNPVITVTDTLPEGMRYVPDSTSYVLSRSDLGADGGWYNPTSVHSNDPNATQVEPQVSEDGRTLTFTFNVTQLGLTPGEGGHLYADVNFDFFTVAQGTSTTKKGEPNVQQTTFTNKASATAGDTDLGETQVSLTGETTTLTKTSVCADPAEGSTDDLRRCGDNEITYTIKVNPQGSDLMPGKDTITLIDLMDGLLTLDASSLKAVDTRTNTPVDVKMSAESTKKDENGGTSRDTKTRVTMTLPDSTPLELTYTATLNSSRVGTDVENVGNVAYLSGSGGDRVLTADKHKFEVKSNKAVSQGDSSTLVIHKKDSLVGSAKAGLPGADFTLHKVDWDKLTALPGDITDDWVRKPDNSTTVGTVTTDANGAAKFEKLELSQLYWYEETKAPEVNDNGSKVYYTKDQGIHYVMLRDPSKDKDAPESVLYQQHYDFLVTKNIQPSEDHNPNVYDSRKTAVATAALGKQLNGRAWSDTDAFSFRLAPAKGSSKGITDQDLVEAMPDEPIATVTKANAGDGKDGATASFNYGQFKFSKTGTYAYTVVELGPDGTTQAGNGNAAKDGITYDQRTATVTFTVKDTDLQNGKVAAAPGVSMGGVATAADGQGSGTQTGAFANSYKATPAEATFGGTKRLIGRDMAPGEKFTFKLDAPADSDTTDVAQATRDGIKDGTIVLKAATDGGADQAFTAQTASTEQKKASGEEQPFTFPTVKFTKAGNYLFTIAETDDGLAKDIVKDSHVATVLVTVKDNGKGQLKASQIHYGNEGARNITDSGRNDTAAFTNRVAISVIPFTGGTAGRDWAVLGGGIALMAGLGYALVNWYRQRKGMNL